MQNEYTVMLYMTDAVRKLSHPMEKDVIKLVKFGTQVPEVILDPFTLYLILSLTSVKKHHQVCVWNYGAVYLSLYLTFTNFIR